MAPNTPLTACQKLKQQLKFPPPPLPSSGPIRERIIKTLRAHVLEMTGSDIDSIIVAENCYNVSLRNTDARERRRGGFADFLLNDQHIEPVKMSLKSSVNQSSSAISNSGCVLFVLLTQLFIIIKKCIL